MANEIKMPAYEHEFSEEHNQSFSKLSSAIKFVAITMMVFGVIYLLEGVMAMSAPLVALVALGLGAVFILAAGWLYSAATSFKDIVVTEGNDVMNLMYALRKLRKAYTLAAWMFAVACILVVLGIFLFLGRAR